MKFATVLDLGLRLTPPYIDGLHRGTVILPSLLHCYFSCEVCISVVVGLTCP